MSTTTRPTSQPPHPRPHTLSSLIRSLHFTTFPTGSTTSSHQPALPPLLLPGGLSTHLTVLLGPEALHRTLWSGSLLQSHRSGVTTAHADYFAAGAELATTCTYQAVPQGLVKGLDVSESEAEELVRGSVALARDGAARGPAGGVRRNLRDGDTGEEERSWVVASIGPYGAFLADGSEYTGSYGASTTHAEFKEFHRPRVRLLADAGVDGFACETMPCLAEIPALLEVLAEEAPGAPAWVSVTVDASGVRMADGTALEELCEIVRRNEQFVAVGVNCVSREVVTGAVRTMRRCMEGWEEGERKTLACYPNSGEVWDAEKKEWKKGSATDRSIESWLEEWVDEGVGMVGGCCRVEPEEIARMRTWIDGKYAA